MRKTLVATSVATLCLAAFSSFSQGAELCELKGPNYLQDADFALEAADKRSKHWAGIQHAGERSFDAQIDDGVLTISRIATQPWYLFRQRIPPGDLGGELMAFTAELKLDLTPPQTMFSFFSKSGGGMQLIVRSRNGSSLEAIFPHEPHMGSSDWFTAQAVVQVPRDVAVIEASFRHEADGSFQVRNASFRKVKDDCEPNVGVPEAP